MLPSADGVVYIQYDPEGLAYSGTANGLSEDQLCNSQFVTGSAVFEECSLDPPLAQLAQFKWYDVNYLDVGSVFQGRLRCVVAHGLPLGTVVGRVFVDYDVELVGSQPSQIAMNTGYFRSLTVNNTSITAADQAGYNNTSLRVTVSVAGVSNHGILFTAIRSGVYVIAIDQWISGGTFAYSVVPVVTQGAVLTVIRNSVFGGNLATSAWFQNMYLVNFPRSGSAFEIQTLYGGGNWSGVIGSGQVLVLPANALTNYATGLTDKFTPTAKHGNVPGGVEAQISSIVPAKEADDEDEQHPSLSVVSKDELVELLLDRQSKRVKKQ